MKNRVARIGRVFALAAASVAACAPPALANSIAQNVAWTIDRPESEETFRIVAYGDSIFAGYKGSISEVAVFSAPTVSGEYASNFWGADVETIRRTKSGAKAGDVYRDKIVDDASYMQTPETRVVLFPMCGNDALRARSDFSGQSGECDYSRLDSAVDKCALYLQKAMQFINANASPSVLAKGVMTNYYPGYDPDDVDTECTDPATGSPVNKQDALLERLARMNWHTCHFAEQYGFGCTDMFAQFMGADADTNDDGRKDSRALRYRKGESEDAYVQRITVTLRSTIRDPNMHLVGSGTTFDYIQSDDTHPTFSGSTVDVGTLGGSGGGSSQPRFPPSKYHGTRNPIWRKFGHERIGHGLALFNPDEP
jgi:hypothetical protein